MATVGQDELRGLTIGILQTRHAEVLANLVARRGARPLVAPTLREETIDELALLREALERLAAEPVDLAVFQTGVGVARLWELAGQMELKEVLEKRLAETQVIARGPKPLSALLQRGVRVDLRTVEPHTTAQVLLLIAQDLGGQTVLVQHHGAPNLMLVEALKTRGAKVLEAFTYHWALPADLAPVQRFFDELKEGRIDVTVFTSAAQVYNLFTIAESVGCAERLRDWLQEKTRIASIGPTTSAALGEQKLAPVIQPGHPKMVPLVEALCAHYSGVV